MIRLYFFGKANEITPWEKDYLKRINFREKFELIDLCPAGIKDESVTAKLEAEKVLEKLSPQDYVIAFDERGEPMSSVKFSEFLDKKMQSSKNIVFLIGGAQGFDKSVRERANQCISLGSMVWTRNLVRLMALEQIYRAFEIRAGSNFHKE